MTTVDPRTIDQNLTNTRNDYYDLVSVLFHALESAKTQAIYRQDAMAYGDQELTLFFEQCQQNDVLRAERAKQLLATRAPQHIAAYNQRGQAPVNQPNQRPMTNEPQRSEESESSPDSNMWPSRSFDE
jgi:hypothetical protein